LTWVSDARRIADMRRTTTLALALVVGALGSVAGSLVVATGAAGASTSPSEVWPPPPPIKVMVTPKTEPIPSRGGDDLPVPPEGDRDRSRILRMQDMLRGIVHGAILGRLRVGMRVLEARSGRLLFGRRGAVLMDPASNQKVLATATAIMRLGTDWRFRTELAGPEPDAAGVIGGDVYLRGSGDPTVRSADIDAMAARLARSGVSRIDGAIVADPRRIGADEPVSESAADAGAERHAGAGHDGDAAAARPPLVVNRGYMQIRVRPGATVGSLVEVTTIPADDSFEVRNSARTKPSGKSKVTVDLSLGGGKIRVDVAGKITVGQAGFSFRRKVPHQALYAAVLLRAALEQAGIRVRDPARIGQTPANLALVERHESAPLGIMLRKINKDSDNDQAERLLEAAGAEVYGGPPTPDKGVQLLREVIGELGLAPASYVPHNGSGLGHSNRITAEAMADLLRALYLDPRIGPEILQSLSVGGVDGTTRNRFKGSLAARRVRAKTGTLNGKSCLSGYVGDGSDVIVFSILVDGLHGKTLHAVRGAQVGAVNAMMRYVREGNGEAVDLTPAFDQLPAESDYETGEEFMELDSEVTDGDAAAKSGGQSGKSGADAVDTFLAKQRPPAAAPGGAAKPAAAKSPAAKPIKR
jgi:D-alanyl-D-alanine carboxypeptidase/D-alanyl-D-alanine-endopeptidase (penicillin-binding protein 4)